MEIKKFAALRLLLKDVVENPSSLESDQCKCLTKYLEEIQAQSVILEPDYTDAGYLLDYSNYYARCHDEFTKVTYRVHFFQCPTAQLEALYAEALSQPQADGDQTLNRHYLGFIVIKPLPMTIIGRTCLRTYPAVDDKTQRRRSFPILRDYHVSLHGIPLTVRSVAFQEQDAEIAACSTAAIWYALHGLPKKVTTTEIPSPFEITSSASATYMKRSLGEVSRKFPTSGLGLEQIEAYFRTHELDCIVCGVALDKNSEQLCEYVAAYVDAGWPIILVGNLYTQDKRSSKFTKRGLHAITALGYAADPDFRPGSSAQRITRLFAHDDNLGPFTSFRVETCNPGDFPKALTDASPPPAGAESVQALVKQAEQAVGNEATSVERRLTGYLANSSGSHQTGTVARRFVPEYLIIPINHKIRFPYESIALFANQVLNTHTKFGANWYQPGTPLPEVAWKARLVEVSQYKNELRTCPTISRDEITEWLQMPMPKYTWKLQFTTWQDSLEVPLLDILFDATALRQSGGLYGMLPHLVSDQEHTFYSIVVAQLNAYTPERLQEVEPELQPMIRAAQSHIQEQFRAAREAQEALQATATADAS